MFKLTASYDMPFGKGKQHLTSGVASYILGNWNISTFMFYQSGYPMGIVDNGYVKQPTGGYAASEHPDARLARSDRW